VLGYTNGLDLWATWETDTFEALLLNAGQFVPAHTFVADLLGAAGTVETSAAGYVRAPVTGAIRTPDGTSLSLLYTGDSLIFGTMATGQFPAVCVIYKKITNDADSLLMGWYGLSGTRDSAEESPWQLSFFEFARITPREINA
jgi:hypothetical protein